MMRRMMEQGAAPARGRRTLLPLPGGAGALKTPSEELADGGPLTVPSRLQGSD
jgi:hypothetical protein